MAAWIPYALLSAVFAALTAIFAKVGIKGVDSDLATAIRTVVILLLAWGIALARGVTGELPALTGRTWQFLVLSGVATGASWLCYFRALTLGPVSKVAPGGQAERGAGAAAGGGVFGRNHLGTRRARGWPHPGRHGGAGVGLKPLPSRFFQLFRQRSI